MTNIEKNVMRRVHTVYRLRPFVSTGALSTFVAVLALYGIGREVWVARVLENAPHDFAALPQFLFSAFTNTDVVVQALSLLVLVATLYIARETSKLITSSLVPAHA